MNLPNSPSWLYLALCSFQSSWWCSSDESAQQSQLAGEGETRCPCWTRWKADQVNTCDTKSIYFYPIKICSFALNIPFRKKCYLWHVLFFLLNSSIIWYHQKDDSISFFQARWWEEKARDARRKTEKVKCFCLIKYSPFLETFEPWLSKTVLIGSVFQEWVAKEKRGVAGASRTNFISQPNS